MDSCMRQEWPSIGATNVAATDQIDTEITKAIRVMNREYMNMSKQRIKREVVGLEITCLLNSSKM